MQRNSDVQVRLCESYEDHLGMIAKVLGWRDAEEGEGVLPFVKACYSYDERNGSFSTWLWHNLVMYKKALNGKRMRNGIKTVPLVECINTPDHMDVAQLVESREWLSKQVERLSEDGKELVRCVLDNQKSSKRRRTKFPSSNTATSTKVRVELKEHCRKVLHWSWPRYWSAVKEVKAMLKKL